MLWVSVSGDDSLITWADDESERRSCFAPTRLLTGAPCFAVITKCGPSLLSLSFVPVPSHFLPSTRCRRHPIAAATDSSAAMAPQPKKKSSGPFAWYDKLADFNVENLFSRKRLPGPPRSVVVHQDLPPEYKSDKGKVKKEHIYSTNQVITSKYTVITFLPRNLLEQFRRVANMCASPHLKCSVSAFIPD